MMSIRFSWYQVFTAVFLSCFLAGSDSIAENRNLNPAKAGVSFRLAKPFSLIGSGKMQNRLKPEIRLNLEKQFIGQHLGLQADLVGIGERKTLDLTAYELGDGYKVKLDFRGINLVYGIGVYNMPGETEPYTPLVLSASPMHIVLSFRPGIQQRRMFLISLEGMFVSSKPEIFYTVTSYPGKKELCRNCAVTFSGQNTLGHLIIDDPPMNTDYFEIQIDANSFILLQTIDITAVD
ncbi:MAG: hypothetical protein FJY09_07045 [Chlorobi bacterium]|nr:hypothetical protein [Chlorobiota bacterium]